MTKQKIVVFTQTFLFIFLIMNSNAVEKYTIKGFDKKSIYLFLFAFNIEMSIGKQFCRL